MVIREFTWFRVIMEATTPCSRSLSPDTEDLIDSVLELGDENLVDLLIGANQPNAPSPSRYEHLMIVRAVAGAVCRTSDPEHCHID